MKELQESGCRILISSRPHVQIYRELRDTVTLELRANETDLKDYVLMRLRDEGNTSDMLKARCLEMAGAHGM